MTNVVRHEFPTVSNWILVTFFKENPIQTTSVAYAPRTLETDEEEKTEYYDHTRKVLVAPDRTLLFVTHFLKEGQR